jgi:hypothetical protein
VLGLAIACLLWLLLYEIVGAIRSQSATRWTSTTGRLKRWDIQHVDGGEDTQILIKNFEYIYSVGGKDYESSTIGFGFPNWMSVLYLERTLKQLLRSAPNVIVFFDPANPQRSVLSVGIQLHHLIKVAGVGFATLVALSLWYGEP